MAKGSAESYRVFVRNWWRLSNGPHSWEGREPAPGARKTTLARRCTEAEARRIAQQYNATHEPGKLSRKAEYESE